MNCLEQLFVVVISVTWFGTIFVVLGVAIFKWTPEHYRSYRDAKSRGLSLKEYLVGTKDSQYNGPN